MKVEVYIGGMGAGKSTLAFNQAKNLKMNVGTSVHLLSFADPLKVLLADKFNMTKIMPDKRKQQDSNTIIYTLQAAMSTLALVNFGSYYFSTVNSILTSLDLDSLIEDIQLAQTTTDQEVYKTAYRRVAQFVGTDIGRAIHPDFWAAQLVNRIRALHTADRFNDDVILIDDLRFLSELKALLKYNLYNPDVKLSLNIIKVKDETRRERLGLSADNFLALSLHESEVEINKICDYIKNKRIPHNPVFNG